VIAKGFIEDSTVLRLREFSRSARGQEDAAAAAWRYARPRQPMADLGKEGAEAVAQGHARRGGSRSGDPHRRVTGSLTVGNASDKPVLGRGAHSSWPSSRRIPEPWAWRRAGAVGLAWSSPGTRTPSL
jgi:hypothetical protein